MSLLGTADTPPEKGNDLDKDGERVCSSSSFSIFPVVSRSSTRTARCAR